MVFDKWGGVEPVGEHVRDVVIFDDSHVELRRVHGGSIAGVMTEEAKFILEVLECLHPDQELRVVIGRITTATLMLG